MARAFRWDSRHGRLETVQNNRSRSMAVGRDHTQR
jgi:hypothetical protein